MADLPSDRASKKRKQSDDEVSGVFVPVPDDVTRVRLALTSLPCGQYGPAPADMTGKEAKVRLELLGVDVAGVVDASELRKMIEERIETKCPVCLDDFTIAETWINLLPCGHQVCMGCMTQWCMSQFGETEQWPQCPMCRVSIDFKPKCHRRSR
jgi:hypothetical protein